MILMLANYGVDRGLGGQAAKITDDDVPFTPAWQEKITGVKRGTSYHKLLVNLRKMPSIRMVVL